MSKFCGNCGAELDDSAQVCGFCGVSLNEDLEKKDIPGIENQANEENVKKAKGLVKIIAPIVAVVVVIIIAISVISNFVGYKGAIRKIMKAYEAEDAATLAAMSSGLYGEEPDEMEDDYQQDIDRMMDFFEEEVGNNVKIKYEIDKVKDVPDRKIDKIMEVVEEDDDIEIDKITEIKELKFDITLKGSDDKKHKSSYDEKFNMYLVKEDGNWKFYGRSLYSDFGLES